MADPAELDVLVVDDEPVARRLIRELLASAASIERVREARNAGEAVREIRSRRPDVVFLDIQMPEVDGFGVIDAVGPELMPPVIFVTAYDRHAIQAFEYHALDYLLKPVDPDRLRDAVARVGALAANDGWSVMRSALQAATRMIHDARQTGSVATGAQSVIAAVDERIALRDGGTVHFVRPLEVDWVESRGNYVVVHLRGGATLRHRATMDAMEARLGPRFLRIRRSTIARASAVRRCEPVGGGAYVLVLEDQTRLTSSRYFRDRVEALFLR